MKMTILALLPNLLPKQRAMHGAVGLARDDVLQGEVGAQDVAVGARDVGPLIVEGACVAVVLYGADVQ